MNRLLLRQIKKTIGEDYTKNSSFQTPQFFDFLKFIDQAYNFKDKEIHLLERTMDLSFQELREAYKKLKETQMRLVQSEKMAVIGQLAAVVAHEINNPIGFINSNILTLADYFQTITKILQLMDDLKQAVIQQNTAHMRMVLKEIQQLEETQNFDFIQKDISMILQESIIGLNRVKNIIIDLNSLARDDNSDEKKFLQISDVIEHALTIVWNKIKKNATVIKNYNKVPLIKSNSQRLGQVFINLFINAAQAMKQKGTLEIETYASEKNVFIKISDTGEGIPQDNLNKIFDPFFTTKPVGKGTGLGLSISYEIIKRHGGDMQVQSEIGSGTTFIIRIPIVPPSPQAQVAQES
ncbi:MAG: histidine kinase [Candidatus Omnitrophica bacterium]|nr:histidine kinase [Candidatus Omnitrophota bacterium]